MQIKTVAVLFFAFSVFSGSVSAWVYESDDSSSDTNTNYNYPENAFTDYDTHNAYVESRDEAEFHPSSHEVSGYTSYTSRLKKILAPTGERLIIVNPRLHVWGAY